MKERIQKLLGSGLSPALVATVVGCDASFISQLLGDPTFALAVAEMRVHDIEELRARDGKYDRLEDQFLERLENLLPMMLKPRDVLSALQVINSAKRRAEAFITPQAPTTVNNIVLLQLPTKTINTFELNNKNEIISVDEKALVAMPTSSLMKEINQNDNSRKPPPLQDRTDEDISTKDGKAERLLSSAIVSEDSI